VAHAVGVRYLRDGTEREVRAGREVLLCGGAINTPQLLLLSGIGPAGQLRAHGIQVLVDAPRVGEGLQDHPWCLPLWRTPDAPNLLEETTPDNLALWQRDGRGPLASNGPEAGGFARSRDGLPAPDLQYGVAQAPDPVTGTPEQRVVSQLVWAADVRSRGSDGDAVCDPELRVRGVEGLRVVDASVLPAIPRGNTNAPVIAVAERAVDLIRGVPPLAPADPAAEPAPVGSP
jgi:choline dehydrogenase